MSPAPAQTPTWGCARELGDRLARGLRGLIAPPLVASEADIDLLVSALASVLEDARGALGAPNIVQRALSSVAVAGQFSNP